MLLMHGSQTIDAPPIHTWTLADIAAHIQFMHDTNAKLVAEGEFVEAQGLAGPDDAKVVRAGRTGTPEVTDGPFPESKEFLAGYWVLDVESEDRAIEVAATVSLAPGPGGAPLHLPIEVRQIMSAPSADA
ncbi:YciI family protein [Actinophytocola sp.]|uniref:YciI family protein n=1 Tax=Actinophytocola sp. TaxID=1872138 RepID=UPI00389AA204